MQYSQIIAGTVGVCFSPDSSFIAYSQASKLYIRQACVQLNIINIITAPSTISEIAISPNSKYIAVFLNKKSTINLYKVADAELAAKIQDSQSGIASFYWAKDSAQLLVFSQFMYKVSIYNLADKTMAYIKGPKFSSSRGSAFTNDGKFMALLEKHDCKDYLSIYYTFGWNMVNSFQLDLFDAVQVRWAPNNSYLVVWDNCINYRLQVFCHSKGQVLKYEPYNFALGIKTVQFSSGSLFLAIGSFDEKIRLLNGITWQEIGILDCSQTGINSEKVIVYKEEEGDNKNRIKIYDGNSFKIPTVKVNINAEKGYPNQGIGLMEFSDDQHYIACRNDNMPHTVWIWDVSKLEPISIISCNTAIKSLKWGPKGSSLSIAYGTDRILFWDPKGCVADCSFVFQNKKMNIQKMKWSKDGGRILICDKNEFAYAELTAEGVL